MFVLNQSVSSAASCRVSFTGCLNTHPQKLASFPPTVSAASPLTDQDVALQCDFIVLRKKYKAQVGTNQKLEKQCKLLQEIGGKQLLELNTLKQDAFRERESKSLPIPITTLPCIRSHHVHGRHVVPNMCFVKKHGLRSLLGVMYVCACWCARLL